MPIYEYTCLECGTDFEKLVRRPQDIQDLKCPVCGQGRMEEKFSACASFTTGTAPATGGGSCAPSGG